MVSRGLLLTFLKGCRFDFQTTQGKFKGLFSFKGLSSFFHLVFKYVTKYINYNHNSRYGQKTWKIVAGENSDFRRGTFGSFEPTSGAYGIICPWIWEKWLWTNIGDFHQKMFFVFFLTWTSILTPLVTLLYRPKL